jgi:hypothetical protein
MDDVVLRALAKWPNVRAVYGWLSLDRRGNWAIKGERIGNRRIAGFIARNYAADERGRWFFQNGPQRVYVSLAYAPLVYRTRPGEKLAFVSHTGRAAVRVETAWLDELGALLVETELGIGVVHDQDLPEVLTRLLGPDGLPLTDEAIERLLDEAAGADPGALPRLDTAAGLAPVYTILAEEVPQRFGFVREPGPSPGEPEC